MKGRIPYETCPLCGGQHHFLSEHKIDDDPRWKPVIDPVLRWHQCDNCGHVFTEGTYTDEAFAELYSDSIDAQKVGYDLEQQRHVFGEILEFSGVGPNDIVLDVGFGNGGLMFSAREIGAEPVGIDLRDENVELMQQLGFDARKCVIEQLSVDTPKFDCVFMLDVVEHMRDPASALKHARSISDGLVISVPNMSNVAAKLMTARGVNPYWKELEHYHNFCGYRIRELLHECGWFVSQQRFSKRYRLGLEILCY